MVRIRSVHFEVSVTNNCVHWFQTSKDDQNPNSEDAEESDTSDEESENGEETSEATASAEIQRAVRGIDNAFKEVDMYAIPHPGTKVVRSSESNELRVTGTSLIVKIIS